MSQIAPLPRPLSLRGFYVDVYSVYSEVPGRGVTQALIVLGKMREGIKLQSKVNTTIKAT